MSFQFAAPGYRSCPMILLVLAFGGPAAVSAQETAPPAALAEDVASIDAIIKAVYDVISGPRGQPRDWGRFRSLFAPGARLIPTGRGPEGVAVARTLTPDEWARNAAPSLEGQGFFEREVFRVTESWGAVTHLFSTYESRRTLEEQTPFARGINSFQLLNDGRRWWIVSIFWQSEGPANPLPAKYLPGGAGR